MGSSINRKKLYDRFKQEATLSTLRSSTSSKNVIKWRGKMLMTGSFRNAFEEVKHIMKADKPQNQSIQ
jgi:hypothetical protein